MQFVRGITNQNNSIRSICGSIRIAVTFVKANSVAGNTRGCIGCQILFGDIANRHSIDRQICFNHVEIRAIRSREGAVHRCRSSSTCGLSNNIMVTTQDQPTGPIDSGTDLNFKISDFLIVLGDGCAQLQQRNGRGVICSTGSNHCCFAIDNNIASRFFIVYDIQILVIPICSKSGHFLAPRSITGIVVLRKQHLITNCQNRINR